MTRELYTEQVRLLLNILPLLEKHSCFSLKGGTALNLFINNFPRLSVDIDLTYLPIQNRADSLKGIHDALKVLRDDVLKELKFTYRQIKVHADLNADKLINKIIVLNGAAQVKVEPNFTIRGEVYHSSRIKLAEKVSEMFAMDLEVQVMSVADIYGGKICAALDRQHPRDLFDILLMFQGIGFTEEIRKAFIVYLLSHNRPMHELLAPKLKDLSKVFNTEFQGMAFREVDLEDLIEARNQLIRTVNSDLTLNERNFLLSFKEGTPDWSLFKINKAQNLPALQWKLLNIERMEKAKHQQHLNNLKRVLAL